jgi:hypothetical protein
MVSLNAENDVFSALYACFESVSSLFHRITVNSRQPFDSIRNLVTNQNVKFGPKKG